MNYDSWYNTWLGSGRYETALEKTKERGLRTDKGWVLEQTRKSSIAHIPPSP